MAGARRSGPPGEHKPTDSAGSGRQARPEIESIAELKDPEARLRACGVLLAADPDDPGALSLCAEAMIALGQVVEALSALHRSAELHLARGEIVLAAEVCGHLLATDPRHQPGRSLARKIGESRDASPEVLQVLEAWRRQRVREGSPVVLATARGRMAAEMEATAETRLPPADPRAHRVEVTRPQPTLPPAAKGDRTRRPPAALDVPTLIEQLSPPQRAPGGSAKAAPPAAKRGPRFSDGAATASLQTLSDVEELAPDLASRPVAPLALRPTRSLLPPELVARGRPRRLARNELLFHESESGHDLFQLLRGQLELVKWERSSRRARIEVLDAGAVFGELALLGDGIQHLSAKALEPCELIQIPKSVVRPAIAESRSLERRLRTQYRDRLQRILLRSSPLFVGLRPEDGEALLERMKPRRMEGGQVAVEEGSPATALHLVLLGTLRVTVTKDRETVLIGKLEDCDFFGEISLLSGEAATATVQTQGFVQLLVMTRPNFEGAIAEHESFRRALEEEGKRRERVIRAILRGTARFDERRGAVVYLPHKK